MTGGTVMVGMSGGVDSSAAALLLVRQGASVHGLFMKNWEEDDRDGVCPAESDALDAAAVARLLGVPFHTRNFASEYWDGVFEAFLAEHRAGRTPNPDVLCNREIKFRTFLEHATDLGATRIATGHYARVEHRASGSVLLRGADPDKDQSYFLHAISQAALARSLFPLGAMRKSEVRSLALERGLPVHAKRDSTGICFIGERDFRGFLQRYIPVQPGPIVDASGRVLGTHQGLAFHTLGQRGGLGIGGVRGHSDAPWYVVGKDLANNRLVVDQAHDSPLMQAREVMTERATWIAGSPPSRRFSATAQCRYRQAAQACDVVVADDGSMRVLFASAQRAATPGQSLVVYDGEVCLGGAVIAATDAAWGGLHAPPNLHCVAKGAAR